MSLFRSISDRLIEQSMMAQRLVLPAIEPVVEAPDGAERVQIIWPQRYDWPNFATWMESIRLGFEALAPVQATGSFPVVLDVVLVQLVCDGRPHLVAFDVGDTNAIDPALPGQVLVYFKLQYRRAGYPFANVVPGGYVPAGTRLHALLPALRRQRDRQKFRADVYGRFGTGQGIDQRRLYLDQLKSDPRFSLTGGFGTRRQSAFLREVASSRICIDLPGQGDFCFRLVEYMAIGSCIVAARHGNRLPEDLVDGRDLVLVDSPAAMADAVADLLRAPDRIERFARASRRYYDRALSRKALAAYYLRVILAQAAARADTDKSI